MMKGKTLTPILLAGIFVLMLGLSFAAVPLYDLFCRVTGFGGTTQVSKEAPDIVLDKVVSVRFDTNVNNLEWDFKAKSNVMDVKVGQVNRIEFANSILLTWPTLTSITFDLALKSHSRLFTFVSNLTLTTLSNTISGASFETWVVPPKPVTLQNRSYKGTAANDKPNIRTKIPANNIGVNVLPFIISAYQILQRYKE